MSPGHDDGPDVRMFNSEPCFCPCCCLLLDIQYPEEVTCCLCLILSSVTAHALLLNLYVSLSPVHCQEKKWKKGDEYNFQSEIPLQRQGGLIKIVLVCVPRVLEILEILGHTGAIIQWWSSWNKQIISYQKLASILSSVCLMRVGHVSLSV